MADLRGGLRVARNGSPPQACPLCPTPTATAARWSHPPHPTLCVGQGWKPRIPPESPFGSAEVEVECQHRLGVSNSVENEGARPADARRDHSPSRTLLGGLDNVQKLGVSKHESRASHSFYVLARGLRAQALCPHARLRPFLPAPPCVNCKFPSLKRMREHPAQ